MSENKWTFKIHKYGKRGRYRTHTSKGKEFPRNALKYYEGTHLGMHKRMWSKSQFGTVSSRRTPVWLHKKYILGLLNKYVGKSYKDFNIAYKSKSDKLYNKYGVLKEDLGEYIKGIKPSRYRWYHPKFYIDNEGILRKSPVPKRKKNIIRAVSIPRRLRDYNSRVQVPDFGEARYGSYHYGSLKPEFKNPLLLGEFYVSIGGVVYKLPVYTFDKYTLQTIYTFRYRRNPIKVEDKWISVSVPGLNCIQRHIVRRPTGAFIKCKQNLDTELSILKMYPNDEKVIQAVNNLKAEMETIPEFEVVDLGYGLFNTYVNKEDYKNASKRH